MKIADGPVTLERDWPGTPRDHRYTDPRDVRAAYLRWREYGPGPDGSETHQNTVMVHRLAAVAWFGWDAVTGGEHGERHVHHENAVRFDTREENLAVMDPDAHTRHHNAERRMRADGGESRVR